LVIYAEVVFLLNFAVDFLLLLGTNRLSGHSGGKIRCALGALLGGAYGLICLLPGLSFLGNPLWRLVSLLVIAGASFGWNRSGVYRCCLFYLLSMALGGIAVHAGREELSALLLCAVLLWGLCTLASGMGSGKREYRVLKLTLGDRSVSMLALVDTGNELVDPITGRSVVVISAKAACRLTGLTEEALQTPLETLTRRPIPGLRLIPYRSVGGQGLLLGMKIRDTELDGKKQSLLVAFSPEGLGNGDVYQALTGGTL